MSEYPKWICAECGEKHGRKLGSIVPGLSLSTYHDGDPSDPADRCGWCGTTENLTEPRDYGYPPKPSTFPEPVEPGVNQQNEIQIMNEKAALDALNALAPDRVFYFNRDDDPSEDSPEQAAFRVRDRKIVEGICPNGCGPMTQDGDSRQECPVCSFTHVVFRRPQNT